MGNIYFAQASGRASQITYGVNTVPVGPGSGTYTWADIVADAAIPKSLSPWTFQVKLDVALAGTNNLGEGNPPGMMSNTSASGAFVPMNASDYFTAAGATGADLRNTKTVDDVAGALDVPIPFPKSRQFTGM